MESHCLISSVFRRKIKLLRVRRQYTLGRTPEADIVLPADTVSRSHAHIIGSPEGFIVEDLGSTNGTRLNGSPLTANVEQSLGDDDLIQVGPFEIRYKVFSGSLDQFLDNTSLSGDETRRWTVGNFGAEGPGGLSGRFTHMELLEIVQLIELNQKEGKLQIEGDQLSGELSFRKGILVSATAAGYDSEEAAFQLLAQSIGRFTFATVPVRNEGDLGLTPSRLIMEVVRRRDERGLSDDIPASLLGFQADRSTRTVEQDIPADFLETWTREDLDSP